MPSTKVHENWERRNITFEVEENSDGWVVTLMLKDAPEQIINIAFASEEFATKAGQALLDYSAGPGRIKTVEKFVNEGKTAIKKSGARKAPATATATEEEVVEDV